MLSSLLIFLLLQTVTSQIGIDCKDCVVAVGGGTANSGDMFNPWAISYHLLQPKFLLEFQTNLIYTQINTNMQTQCKTGYVFDFGSIASSPYPINQVGPNTVAFPFYSFAVVIVYNIPGINTSTPLSLSRGLIYNIFNLNVTQWDDPQILRENPQFADVMPNATIVLILRSDLAPPTKALSANWHLFNATRWTNPLGSYTFPKSRIPTYTAMGSRWSTGSFDSTSQVSLTPFSIGYVPNGYAKMAGLPVATLVNRYGNKVTPSTESLQSAMNDIWNDTVGLFNFSFDPLDTWGPNSYPYTLVSWLMVHQVRNLECANQRELFKFLNWCYTDPQAYAQISGSEGSYSPLTPTVSNYVMSKLRTFTCATVPLLAVSYVDTNWREERAAIKVLASALMSFAVTVFAALIYTRNSRITKAAGLAFAGSFLMGCIFNYTAVFLWAMLPDSDIVCQSRVAFLAIGETLILGAMFSKSWEINKIFQRVEKGDISPFQEIPWWKFCRIFFILCIMQLILLASLMVTDPPKSSTSIDDTVNLIGSHSCSVKKNIRWLSLEGSFFFYLSLWGGWLAYKTRHVWTRYKYPNESKGILLAIYNTAFSVIIAIPPLSLLSPSEDTLMFIVSFAILYPTTFALTSVYVPKLASFLGSSFKRSKHSKGSKGSKGSRGSKGGSGRDPPSVASRGAKHGHHSTGDHDGRQGKPENKVAQNESPQKPLEGSGHVPAEIESPTTTVSMFASGHLPQPSPPSLQAPPAFSGTWRILLNPVAGEGGPNKASVFDSPEVAAQSALMGGSGPL